MNDQPASLARLSEIARLADLLADRALDALSAGCSIPAEEAVALAKAAHLLQEHDMPWPSLLEQVIQWMARDAEPIA